MMNLQRSDIPVGELNAALAELNFQSAHWYRTNYSESYRVCVEAEASRLFLLAMMNHMFALQRSRQDFSIPMVYLAATMLQIGYRIGRKRAETEILEGWMRL